MEQEITLLRAIRLIEERGADVEAVDAVVSSAMELGHDCLAEHIARVGGASQQCREELFKWSIEHSSRYVTTIAELLNRDLTKVEVREVIDCADRYSIQDPLNQVGIGILYPEVAKLRGVTDTIRIELAEKCESEGCHIAALDIIATMVAI